MSRKGRVLLVDDIEKWRETLASTLERGGFQADVAGTIEEALKHLSETFYHLAVLDISMNTDAGNAEGMTLLSKLKELGLSESMEVVMLSAYGTLDQMRTAFAQYRVADFLSKDDFDNLEFLKQVRLIFSNKVQINLKLIIHWQQIAGPEQAVINLYLDGARVKRDTPLQARVAAELDDLLCRLFHNAESLLVKPLTPGQSGAGVLWVQPFYADTGGAQPRVVKFGDFHEIDQEFGNFMTYVKSFLGSGRSTTIQDPLGRTPRLGGIIYSLLDAPKDNLESFGDFYRHADLSEIKEVLNRLFLETCSTWYANPGKLLPYDLTEDYQGSMFITTEKLEQALADNQKSVQGKLKLHFNSLGGERSFTNPIFATAGRHFIRPTYMCTTHGDFNDSNILVDNTGHTWLIDFRRTGPGHILRDVAELDSFVRFKLLGPEEATLAERLEMEDALSGIKRFSQLEQLATNFSTTNQALAKAYGTSVHLRTIARKLVAQNPSDDISEYYIALFYYAVNTIRFYHLPTLQREHALLSASLLVDKFGL